jgi:hypothetical protein
MAPNDPNRARAKVWDMDPLANAPAPFGRLRFPIKPRGCAN